jgi:hypothetical protein
LLKRVPHPRAQWIKLSSFLSDGDVIAAGRLPDAAGVINFDEHTQELEGRVIFRKAVGN